MNKLYKTILISLTLIVLPPALTQAEPITIEDGAIATTIKTSFLRRQLRDFPLLWEFFTVSLKSSVPKQKPQSPIPGTIRTKRCQKSSCP